MHRAARVGLPVVALAAGLPPLFAGMVATTSPEVLVGPRDDTVRTVLVDRPPPPLSDHPTALDGAHPPRDPAARLLGQAVDNSARTAGRDRSRGLPVRVSGTALPARVLLAYRNAAADLRRSDPACHLPWSLLAGIGQVESGQAYGGAVDRQGRTLTPILGPVLDGSGGFAAIPDTDGGRWDGDRTWDRAVGPMQFIPSSWAVWGRDGDGNGTADPSDIDDAALAAGSYLCAGDRNLSTEKDRRSAVFSYNHSWDYVDLVLAYADAYATGKPVLLNPRVGTRGPAKGNDRGADGGTVVRLVPIAGPLPPPGTPLPPGTVLVPPDAGSATATAPPSAAPVEGTPASSGSGGDTSTAPATSARPSPSDPTSAAPATAPSPDPSTTAPSPDPSTTAPSPDPSTTAPSPSSSPTAPSPTPTCPSPTPTDASPSPSPSPVPSGCPTSTASPSDTGSPGPTP